jgi:hypothetical protein
MQTVPVNVTNEHNGSLTFESEKPLVHTPDNTFLLKDLNVKSSIILDMEKQYHPYKIFLLFLFLKAKYLLSIIHTIDIGNSYEET